MGNLHFDPLAIGALVGFGSLVLIMAGITVWIVRKAFSAPEPDAIKRPEE
ncbi:MAG TPA: hypothetical protein PLR76_12585 [Hyphomonas sp.]|nr:hypothetical protein [Hyphomonas sp.]MCB9961157.1 hypothetical protein [Hyphomonas sp.]MCB9970448.1 hypothetical protein [Hyphomonas sp.]HPE49234.1 hypothetical protein [Hyphomonas sp.]